ncbi:TrmH family RNA methyltransferase [Alicyclobacillus vulcanalis]|uniref:tRNA (guanosine(18)-2'-O)-methyltransferase n=1 Tax=Alicyclobacillus vulcanalis TaxID=252246 RepID=A0A1N7PBN9_9BACL|nr:RNA methyltransferase [Alicyclobacillus vulcanalis]SIT07960.1 tRNA (guanosine-2'-O-)-methyltransferase [Alicyclobacillus vulcanalis]
MQADVKQLLRDEGLLLDDELWLADWIRPERLCRLRDVLSRRTGYLAVAMEAVDDGHNQAAILRSAEAFGIQYVTVVEGQASFRPSKGVTQGAHKWLTLSRMPTIRDAVDDLHARGFQVYVTDLGEGAKPIGEIDLGRPTAILFGNEKEGVSDEARSLADGRFYIPMAGFVQSFNVSVAAAVTLYELTRRARAEAGARYALEPSERHRVFVAWCVASLHGATREEAIRRLAARGWSPGDAIPDDEAREGDAPR